MSTSVIFALTADEAEAGVKYQRTHPEENTVVLAPELAAQRVLIREGLPAFEYFNNSYFHRHLYTISSRRSEQQVYDLTQIILRFFTQTFPDAKDYLLPLQNWLEMAYLEVLATYDYYTAVEKQWRPNKYIISQKYKDHKTDLYAPFASQWELLRAFFIPRNKLKILQVTRGVRRFNIQLPFHLLRQDCLQFDLLATVVNRIKSRYFKIPKTYRIPADILIFSGGRNLYTYERLIKLLRPAQLRLQIITSSQTLPDEVRLRQKQIPFTPLAKFLTPTVVHSTEKYSAKVLAQLLPVTRLKFTQIFKAFPVVVKAALIKKTDFVVKENLYKIVQQTLLSNKILEIYSPRLLITTHDPGPSAMPFVLSAKKRHIFSLLFMHGWQDTLMGVNHQSDTIAVWGSYTAKWYQKKLHKKSSNIFPLGYPLFDDLFMQDKNLRQKKVRHWSPASPLRLGVLMTMHLPNTALMSKFLYELFTVSAKIHLEHRLSLRLHPSQPVEGIKDLAFDFGLSVEINSPVSLDEFVISHDVILSWDTTAMFWAMIYGKPLFYCAPNWGEGITPIKQLGGAWLAYSAEDLFKQIDKLIEFPAKLQELRKSQRNFLKKVIGILDGTSSEKHVQLISKLLRKQHLKST